MTRDAAIAAARKRFTSGAFREVLARRVAMRTESRRPDRRAELAAYLSDEIAPWLAAHGFRTETLTHASAPAPFLFAERIEDPALPTIFSYAHGDVVNGFDEGWSDDLSPWAITEVDGRWYGRGVADNKGQHTVNLEALAAVLETRGRLGFNTKILFDMGEEMGCPGLGPVVRENAEKLAAELLVASDGPRLAAGRPTLFMGARGAVDIVLTVTRRKGGHHSGNWGGLLANPAIELTHALASIVGPKGQIRVPGWTPERMPDSVRSALAGVTLERGPDDPEIDPDWGEPGLIPAEQLYGWCSFEILSQLVADPSAPVSAIPPSAWARCQLRFTADITPETILPALRRHLDAHGFGFVEAGLGEQPLVRATRLDPDDPVVARLAESVTRTLGRPPALLPNFGGTLPNDIFALDLGMKTIWVPHSYPGCRQHGTDEHVPAAIFEEGLAMMAGIFWDLGEPAG